MSDRKKVQEEIGNSMKRDQEEILEYLRETAKPALEALGHKWKEIENKEDGSIVIETIAPLWEAWVTRIGRNGSLTWCSEQSAPDIGWGKYGIKTPY
tara:strand:- start:262 stop:552 length:291 start_codon:yes stop_codon:yes gene_type:complete